LPAIPVGFPLDDTNEPEALPPKLQARLAKGERPILIAGGTTKLLVGTELFSESIKACQQLSHSGLLIMKNLGQLPSQLPDEVTWYEYVPFTAVMPYISAIIHHGG